MSELSAQESEIFEQTLKTGNWGIFTQHYFQLPKFGKPDSQMFVEVDGVETAIHVSWDYVYYGDNPLFLPPHGFRMLP